MTKDKSNYYASAVGIAGIAILLFASGAGLGQGLEATLIGAGTTAGYVGTKYYEQTTITTNYHMAQGLDWRWVEHFKLGSSMIGKQINTMSMPLMGTGNPVGTVFVAVFAENGAQKYTFHSMGAATVSKTALWYTFQGTGTYTVVAGDRIGVAFNGGSSANYITAFGANTNPFETDVSLRNRFNGTAWMSSVNEDLTAVIGFTTPTGGGGDTVVPAVAITQPTQGATVTSPFIVKGTASDNVKVDRVEVKTEWTDPTHPCTTATCPPYVVATPKAAGDWSTWSVTLNPTQASTVTARATDSSGNQQWSMPINVNMYTPGPVTDTTPPSITITTPASSASIASTSVGVSGVASDNAAIATITWSMDGSAFSPVSFSGSATSKTWSFTALDVPVGTHTITVRALDTAGLTANAQVIFTVTSTTPIPPPTCPTGYTYDPILKVCTGTNPPPPTCPAGFTYDAVLKVCTQDDLPDPNPISGNMTLWIAGGLTTVGAVIATKAATKRK